MHRVRKVAQGNVGDSLRNNIDGQIGERNISIAGETTAYENRRRRRERERGRKTCSIASLSSPFDFNGETLLVSFHINIL